MNMSGGAINSVNWLCIGRSGGSGTLNMLGGSITKTTITGNIVISGGSASGQTGLMSQSGGTVTNLDSQTWVGESGTGTYTISGSAVADLGLVNVGTLNAVNSVGIVNLDGGTFVAKQIIKGGAAASGTLNFNGGTLKANTAATGATFLQGMSAANVRDGGAIIDTNAQDITIAQLLQHSVIDGDAAVDGGLTKNGTGKLTLSASNTFTGDTTVSAGTLSLAAAALADASEVIIESGAVLELTHSETDIVDSLTINGVAMANGVYGAIGSGAQFENAAITGSGKLQVGTNPYDSWATSKGLTGGDALSSADPDNDGMVNLMEFFLDGSPTSFTSAPAASAVGSNLSISFKRRDDAEANVASQFVRVSTDLVNWTDVAIPTASGTVSGVTFTIVENGADADDVTASVPMGADVKKFLGVKVTEN
jgi:autotransporter-associated beta strand protein